MAEQIVGNPLRGVWRWIWEREIRPHWLRAALGSLALPVIAAIIYPIFIFDSTASLHDRIWAGVAAAGIAFAGFLVFGGLVVLVIAPYEQRNALRKIAQGLDTTIAEKDDAIAQLHSKRLDSDHEEGIKGTLRSLQSQTMRNETVQFGSAGEKDSLVGHVPTVMPLVENWNEERTIDSIIDQRLTKKRESEIVKFDPHVYSFDALRVIFDFALHRATTPEFGIPFQIPWAPLNDHTPDEVRILRGQNEPSFAARANAEVDRKQAMERIQKFLDDVLSWDDLARFGDTARIDTLGSSKSRLLAELSKQIEKHGFIVGAGCSRCPQ